MLTDYDILHEPKLLRRLGQESTSSILQENKKLETSKFQQKLSK